MGRKRERGEVAFEPEIPPAQLEEGVYLDEAGPHFRVKALLGVDERVLGVELVGEIDLAVVERIWPPLSEAITREANSRLEVDLSGVSFIDSTGLRLLLRMKKRTQEVGSELLLRHPAPCVVELLRITKLTAEFQTEL